MLLLHLNIFVANHFAVLGISLSGKWHINELGCLLRMSHLLHRLLGLGRKLGLRKALWLY